MYGFTDVWAITIMLGLSCYFLIISRLITPGIDLGVLIMFVEFALHKSFEQIKKEKPIGVDVFAFFLVL